MIVSSFINSLVEINIYLISLSVLWFLIHGRISFFYQRLLLLFIPVISVLIWFTKAKLSASGMVYAVVPLDSITVQNYVSSTSNEVWKFDLDVVYQIGVSVFMLVFVVKIIRVLFFFKDAYVLGSVKLNDTSNEDSFSFFNFIHLRADLSEEEKNVVLEHELIHYQKRHSFDLMIYEIYHSLFWFNPLLILLKKELVNIHEFEVDQEMYATHKTDYMRHLLSYALGSNDAHYLLTSRFYNKLTLKKRINTMKNSNRSNSYILLFSLPILAVVFTVVSCQNAEIESPVVNEFQQTTEARKKAGVVMDASELTKQTEFPGGEEKLYEYLGKNIKYPEAAKKAGIEGRVFINFVVTETGEITEAKVLRDVDKDLDAEALRVINTMPNWSPAEKNGHTVAVQYTIPIMFKLQ